MLKHITYSPDVSKHISKVVWGGLRWFAVVCGGLGWFAVVCGNSTVPNSIRIAQAMRFYIIRFPQHMILCKKFKNIPSK